MPLLTTWKNCHKHQRLGLSFSGETQHYIAIKNSSTMTTLLTYSFERVTIMKSKYFYMKILLIFDYQYILHMHNCLQHHRNTEGQNLGKPEVDSNSAKCRVASTRMTSVAGQDIWTRMMVMVKSLLRSPGQITFKQETQGRQRKSVWWQVNRLEFLTFLKDRKLN